MLANDVLEPVVSETIFCNTTIGISRGPSKLQDFIRKSCLPRPTMTMPNHVAFDGSSKKAVAEATSDVVRSSVHRSSDIMPALELLYISDHNIRRPLDLQLCDTLNCSASAKDSCSRIVSACKTCFEQDAHSLLIFCSSNFKTIPVASSLDSRRLHYRVR